jgi:two-component system sensor histidine kinase RegB
MEVEEVVAEIVKSLPPAQRCRLAVRSRGQSTTVTLPRGAVLRVAQSLLQNAFEAAEGPVDFSLDAAGEGLRMVVRDSGPGMARDVLARVGEPFFSTKAPGSGLGLGVFIARTLSEQMGGRLRLESSPGRGTTATVEIGALAGDVARAG